MVDRRRQRDGDLVKRDCPQCEELRREYAKGAHLGDLLERVALHEAVAHPRRKPKEAVKALAVTLLRRHPTAADLAATQSRPHLPRQSARADTRRSPSYGSGRR